MALPRFFQVKLDTRTTEEICLMWARYARVEAEIGPTEEISEALEAIQEKLDEKMIDQGASPESVSTILRLALERVA